MGCPIELQTWASQHGLSGAATEGFLSCWEISGSAKSWNVPSGCLRTCFSSGTHLQSRNPGPALRRIMLQCGSFTEARGDIWVSTAHRCCSLDLFGELFGKNTADGARHSELPLARLLLFGKEEQPVSVCFAVWMLFSNESNGFDCQTQDLLKNQQQNDWQLLWVHMQTLLEIHCDNPPFSQNVVYFHLSTKKCIHSWQTTNISGNY